jgi:hypothetical protein
MEETENRIYRKKEKAQTMVEFALTLPLLLMLFFGIIEFGRLLFYYSGIVTATREAARYGSAAGGSAAANNYYQDCDGIRAAAKRIGSFVGIDDGDVVIIYDHGPSTGQFGSCPPGGTGPALKLGDRIVITVTGHFKPFVGFVNLPAFDISSVAKRTIVRDVFIKKK